MSFPPPKLPDAFVFSSAPPFSPSSFVESFSSSHFLRFCSMCPSNSFQKNGLPGRFPRRKLLGTFGGLSPAPVLFSSFTWVFRCSWPSREFDDFPPFPRLLGCPGTICLLSSLEGFDPLSPLSTYPSLATREFPLRPPGCRSWLQCSFFWHGSARTPNYISSPSPPLPETMTHFCLVPVLMLSCGNFDNPGAIPDSKRRTPTPVLSFATFLCLR